MFRTPPKYRRLEHLLENNVPTQTEVRSYLGSSLAQIFNDHCNETTRKLLGVVPPLKGPVLKDLWISPSDQLIGKVALKPPLTNKCTKAYTHQGILEIGERAALKFAEETEENIRERLQRESIEKRKMFEAEKRRAIELSVRECRDEYEKRIECLNKDFEKKLEMALGDATIKSNKEMQKAVIRERMDVELEMMKKLREEIGRVVVSLNDEFEQSFRAQRDNMVADFNAIMRQERKKVDARIESYERKKSQDMLAQRREFETRNIADAAFILCTERMRCASETHTIHQSFERKIEALERLLMESRKNAREEETKGAKINRSTLDDKVDEREIFEVVEIIDKDGKLWRPIRLEPEIPQLECADKESTFPIVSSEINFFPADQYTDRISVPSAESLRTYDSLPFCYLEDKLYVRSDYREKYDGQEFITEDKKTMGELAEGARFIMELRRKKSCSRSNSGP